MISTVTKRTWSDLQGQTHFDYRVHYQNHRTRRFPIDGPLPLRVTLAILNAESVSTIRYPESGNPAVRGLKCEVYYV